MAMIVSGKSKRVRRKLLQDQLTLAEALKYARGLESADQHATKVETQTPTDVTVNQEVDKITVYRTGKKSCFNCGKQCPHQGDQENSQLSASKQAGLALEGKVKVKKSRCQIKPYDKPRIRTGEL